ncbi:MAG: hypothetical protein IPI29_03175 [Ignavibacteria bacterium]|nr:hypothetical protein [Ignavibacteria bacterium]MBK7411537.1 hypothetical protein [Ignavibacteria bacterium]
MKNKPTKEPKPRPNDMKAANLHGEEPLEVFDRVVAAPSISKKEIKKRSKKATNRVSAEDLNDMKSKPAPSWKLTEQIVAGLEQYVSPNSTVEHNKRLPILSSPTRRLRQCDVVITYGPMSRKHVTIVEVQKQNRKPTLNEFDGWIAKMKQVGANQLICVSEQGFPASIVEAVKTQHGNAVLLMTLSDFDYIANPQRFNVVNYYLLRKSHYEIEEIGPIHLTISKNEPLSTDDESELKSLFHPLDFHRKMFSFVNEPGHISMAELLARAVDSHPDYEAVASSNSVVKMPISISEESNTYLDSGRVRCRIEEWTFVLVITFTHEARPNNVSQYAYRQEIEGDVLVWVSSFEMTVDGETTRYELWTKNVNGALEMQIRKYVNPLEIPLDSTASSRDR